MVKKIPKSVFRHLEFHHRVAIAMLLLEDKVGLKELAYYRRHGGKLAGKFIKQGNRVYWVSSRSNTPSNDAWIKELQDVTSTKIFDTPSDQCVYFHQLESINKSNHRMELKGITKDPLKKFDFSKKVDAQLILQYNKKEQTNHNILASISVSPSNEIVWSVIVDSSSIPARFSHGRYHIILELKQGYRSNKSKIFVKNNLLSNSCIITPSLPNRLYKKNMQLYRTANGNVALKLAISKRPALLMRLDRRR